MSDDTKDFNQTDRKPDLILECGGHHALNPHTRYHKWAFGRPEHTWRIGYRMWQTPVVYIYWAPGVKVIPFKTNTEENT